MADNSRADAMWLLDRIEASEAALAALRADKAAGRISSEAADEQSLPHRGMVEKLYDAGGAATTIEVPVELAGVMRAVEQRDLLSGDGELIEKALAAYIERHPERDAALPREWQTTIAAARSEVNGETQGAFGPDFTTRLATAAHDRRQLEAARDRGSKGRER